jgi:putative peptide maturation system protein
VARQSLSEYAAMEVNGETVDLQEVLRAAKFWGELGFLERVADALLIRQEAGRRGLAVSDEELQQAADAFRAARELHKVEDLERWLAARQLSFEDWEAQLEDESLTRKLRAALTSGQIEQRFAEQKLSFDAATVSWIFVGEEDLARELRAQILEEGADFHALARQHSRDEENRAAGGYAGLIKRGELAAEADAAVFGAQAGEVTPPIKINQGWYLFKVEALHPATLDAATRETIQAQLFKEWLAEQRRKARIHMPLLELNQEEEE